MKKAILVGWLKQPEVLVERIQFFLDWKLPQLKALYRTFEFNQTAQEMADWLLEVSAPWIDSVCNVSHAAQSAAGRSTSVGTGTLLTAMENQDEFRKIANEFGATTRPSPAMSATSTPLPPRTILKICVAYEGAHTENPIWPQTAGLKPVYEVMESWSEDITGCRTFAELPKAAQQLIPSSTEEPHHEDCQAYHPCSPCCAWRPCPPSAMTLKSSDIHEGQLMDKAFSFNGFGCSGDNRSPQLSWQDLPAGTKSVAIHPPYDPDAPHRQRLVALAGGASWMSTPLLQLHHYLGIRQQPLHRVLIYAPTIIWVEQGHKQLWWQEKRLAFDQASWLLIPGRSPAHLRAGGPLETALACGYDSPSRFAARFKQEFGLTPYQYLRTCPSSLSLAAAKQVNSY
ncbi:UNVERIFIED_CONTAM: hypothetical protein K2H54_000116 [Gekko kuhli]